MAFADHPREEILRPVRGSFILLSLVASILLSLAPLTDVLHALWPDFAAMTLLYWCINQPQRVGMTSAFSMGLLMDVGNAAIFGQHALAYSIMAFIALLFHRRLHNFGLLQQAPQMGLILLAGQSVMLLTWLLNGMDFPPWDFFLGSVTGTLLWPLLASVLRAPQKPRRTESNTL
ncbi:rod shape-determining protein MreD [Nitrosovibrio sp. Nv17]|uniref:rod shape-determining protein MreD n=1 Tax=Nitrosovibrio sp. Nv17 TaxID=1855339 RepID=UPI000909101F|nr:rod shape-determining protein MreD [Nitrosovibrio sp. Nv17]SFW10646.1 rod shape-determining protein MreD [Nitrosovibrio sp. Nv17]